MGGNKEERLKRRQRNNMKRAARKKVERRTATASPPAHPASGVPHVSSEAFPEEMHLFWMAHGINYLLSNHQEGLWTPLFESLYEGATFSQDEIGLRVMEKFAGVKEWPVEGKAALAWVVTDRTVMYIYYREILRRMHSAFPDAEDLEVRIRQPHHPVVWGVFNYLKEKLLGSRSTR